VLNQPARGTGRPTAGRFYKRPTWVRRHAYDPAIRALILRLGWTGFGKTDTIQVLCIRGRRSGRWYRHPVGVCTYAGDDYIVSFYGDSEWARNMRAGCESRLEQQRESRAIRGVELEEQEKRDFLRYLIAKYGLITRVWWKISPKHVTAEDMDRLVARYPIFRIETALAAVDRGEPSEPSPA
jgi:F420H(2)-dependent quinone reductase